MSTTAAIHEASDRVIDVIEQYSGMVAGVALINATITMLYNECRGDRAAMERGFEAMSRDIIEGIRNNDPEFVGKPN